MPISPESLRFFLSVDGLGGAITSVPLSDALFPTVRGVEAERGLVDYACFYFVNLDAAPDGLLDPHVWFERTPNASEVTIGVDPAGKNEDAQVIKSREDAPVGVTFSSPMTDVLPFYLPSGPYFQNDRVALWVRREVPAGSPPVEEGFRLRIRGESF